MIQPCQLGNGTTDAVALHLVNGIEHLDSKFCRDRENSFCPSAQTEPGQVPCFLFVRHRESYLSYRKPWDVNGRMGLPAR